MDKKKKITLKDIAEALNLTPSGVSKALNNHPRISDATKKAVKEKARELNYQPNLLASALRKGRSNLIGVIIPRAKSNFFSSVVEKLEDVLNKEGYNIIMTQSNESFEKECRNIDALIDTQVCGIIASMASDTVDLTYYNKIISTGIPLVMFDRSDEKLEADYIGIDDYQSSFKVIDHLYKQGCRRIAHIGGYKHTRIYNQRLEGYLDALKKYNLPIENNLIIESTLKIEDGRQAMTQFLKLDKKPDAVYAAGDFAALGALQVLKENNIAIPQDIALVGFSNELFTSLVTPTISSIEQHSNTIGQLAAEILLDKLKNPNKTTEPSKTVLDIDLIIRETSKK
ncbi:LacI family transcriptional regulator [Polaribacter sp. Z014]|uniref:LacI family DNA-binding transcriptional regulator n=1 Tax=Polaribacter sp. Z014 TaxID=2927126 RepID=UPI002022330E|nr:LacI family DNA-binding transcriptional regulator [Polaribacter sp. Z014]MCL7762577.1 LacI family transcriptional regulator [Polaribacter sp. Z014]